MKKFLPIFLVCFAAVAFVVGCAPNGNGQATNNGVVYISPTSLFKGNTQILQPHLGLIGGCVDIKYKGKKKLLTATSELWENGKLTTTLNSLGTQIDGNFTGEISVSLKKDRLCNSNNSFREVVKISQNGGSCSSSLDDIPAYNPQDGSGPKELPGETQAIDNQHVAVWGLMSNKGPDSYYSNQESIEQMAKRVNWAFVLVISFSNQEPKPPHINGKPA